MLKTRTLHPRKMVKSVREHPKRRVKNPQESDDKRRMVEKALRESEENYRTLTENVPVGIFRSTPGRRGKFLEVNPALVKILGYRSKKELFAKDVSRVYENPRDRLGFSKRIAEKGLHQEEMTLRKKDGTTIIVSMTAIAVRDEKGRILYFDGIVDDITKRKQAEEELLLQKTYLEILFNSAPEAIVLHDNNDRIVNVNDEFTRMFGYSRGESIGKPINALVASAQLRNEAARISRTVLSGKRVEIDTKRKRKDGTLLDVSILGSPIIHAGKQMGDYAIYRDITVRKKAEEELYVQTSYLERLFNSAPEAIVWHDNDDLVINVNDEFTRMFGYTREDAIGKPINDLVAPPELRGEARSLSQRVARGQRVEVDSRRKCKDGTLVDVSILGAPIFHGGNQMGVYAVYRDITERKVAEEQLHIQKTYFQRLFNSAPEAIILHDNNDVVVDVNDEFTRMFGYSREEAIGRFINDLVASPEYKDEASRLSSGVIHGERVELDSRRKRKDGSLIDVSILGAPIIHEGTQMAIYAIYRDITERKKAEEVRIRVKEESRMARNIQANLLPKSNPDIPGYDLAGKNISALNVGGDYYDFIRLDEHRLAIGLGDVSGKGLAASLVMANLQATIRGLALFDPDPKDCLERANKLLFRSTDSRTFVSLFYGILDTRRHTLSYASAGQDMPMLFSSGMKPTLLKTRGIALGIKEDVTYAKEEISILPGDRILIYTDGISEAMNEKMEEFGKEKLQALVQRAQGERSAALIDNIIAAVSAHVRSASQSDDMTIVLVQRLTAADAGTS
ncbi:MAG: PAS domain S-box protein [Ignavibacteriales bacterium]|nr:PAS domain S-box protein [Ignavibacteriales bacterium]